jgi:heptosyltransferase-3
MRRLLIRPGAIGDCILALPELESYKAAYTEVWAPRPVLPLIQFAERTQAIADTRLDLLSVVNDIAIPEFETFDSIYSWYGSNRPEFRDAVRHLPFTFFPALPINRIILSAEGAFPREPRLKLPNKPIEDFAAIHPFSGSVAKNWPLERFVEVASRLQMPSRFCAGPDDPPIDAVRIPNLLDLAAWLATARVYIGNDSGITHLAAAAGVPTVAIFLSTDPAIWAPRGDHVRVLENPSVDSVIAAAHAISRRPARLPN